MNEILNPCISRKLSRSTDSTQSKIDKFFPKSPNKIAKIEPHYTCKIENEDTNSLAIENYSPELQIENLSADVMETGPSSGVIVSNILDVTDFNFYNYWSHKQY